MSRFTLYLRLVDVMPNPIYLPVCVSRGQWEWAVVLKRAALV